MFSVKIKLILACIQGHAHNVPYEVSTPFGQFLNSWRVTFQRIRYSLPLFIIYSWLSVHMYHKKIYKITHFAESCQLLRRHWSITFSDGRTEDVDGEGVIGEQPTFNPGDLYQYSSCTMFDEEEYCQMEGYFLMKYLNRSELCLYW